MHYLKPLVGFSNSINLVYKTSNYLNIKKYAFKTELKIKWICPGKASCISVEKSGDLEPMPVTDKTQTQLQFRNCKELEDANDLVKRLFSVEFAPRRIASQMYIKSIGDSVRRHPLDKASIEAKIARWTGCIRSFQEVVQRFPRNTRVRVDLKELIDKRKKNLKKLRKLDYKRFEWLIDTLDIVYKPEPQVIKDFTRKFAMVKLTDKYCDDIKNERLLKYKLQLEAEQPSFLQTKISSLEFIRKEQIDCGVEVTITQEEIDNTKKLLEELLCKGKQSKPDED